MIPPEGTRPTVAIIGAGRAGRALALALTRASVPVLVCVRRKSDLPPGINCSLEPWTPALESASIILVAVPDDAIGDVATRLREARITSAVVLHCSGLRDRTALSALEGRAAGLGSFHPLQTLAGDTSAAERLQAAYAVLEGDAVAVAAGRRLAMLIGMQALEIKSADKPLYHAAAVIVSNYTVALSALAERLALGAGIPADAAGRIFLPLLEGTWRNLEMRGTTDALTGPIVRGDAGTVRAHLEALDDEARRIYAVMGLEALKVARKGGLADSKAAEIEAALRDAMTAR
jgi:predicted short-subunit dehydrogenase-like oxidoreductase (DUF2520 family)